MPAKDMGVSTGLLDGQRKRSPDAIRGGGDFSRIASVLSL